MQYSYPCRIEPDGDGWVASFPDVPEALTGDSDYRETVELAADALVTALSRCYVVGRVLELSMTGARMPEQAPDHVLVSDAVSCRNSARCTPTMRRASNHPDMDRAHRLVCVQVVVQAVGLEGLVDVQHRSHIEQVERAFRSVGRLLVLDDSHEA